VSPHLFGIAHASNTAKGVSAVTQALKDANEAVIESTFDRRKAKRLFLNFSVEISGMDRNGQPVVEQTKTDDISDTGCRLVTTIPVRRGDVVDIRLTNPPGTKLPEESAQQFEIMWVHPTRAGWSVGARKVLNGKIWKVSFPPPRSNT
jgi:hypothetical protein